MPEPEILGELEWSYRGGDVDYNLRFDPKHRVLLVVMGRTITKAIASAAQNAVRHFMVAEGPCSVIADLSAIEREQVPGCFVRSLAWTPSATPAGRCLILVAPQTVIYGLSRMFQLWRGERARYKVVRTVDEGYELLDLDASDFRIVL
jgi:hypothetical protein